MVLFLILAFLARAVVTAPPAAAASNQPNASSVAPSVSGDGRYTAFTSYATNIVPDDTNGTSDIFVRDRATGVTSRVSVSSAGTQADSYSGRPSISADGRYVAFSSRASNLGGVDAFGEDIFVRDRVTGTTEVVSVSPSGEGARCRTSDCSQDPTLSSDGRYVAFWSHADNLVAGDTNGWPDIFIRDRVAGTTSRASVGLSGAQANHRSEGRPFISGNGRYVAFWSYASNLVPGDTNNAADVFVYDRTSASTTRVSVLSSGAQANTDALRDHNFEPSISADGRYVAFSTLAALTTADTNGDADIYVRDTVGNSTIWASQGTNAPNNGGSTRPSISGDGQHVAFESYSALWSSDTNRQSDVYGYELSTGSTTLLSMDSWYKRLGDSGSYAPTSSTNGLIVAFASAASNLVPQDTNAARDIVVHVFDPKRIICYLAIISVVTLAAVLVAERLSASKTEPTKGQLVYRVWGGDADEFAEAWTPVNPENYGPEQFRIDAGLPDRQNLGTMVTWGMLDDIDSVTEVRPSLSVNPNEDYGNAKYAVSGVAYRSYPGQGVIEYRIPDARVHVLSPQRKALVPSYGGPPAGCVPAPRGCVGEELGVVSVRD